MPSDHFRATETGEYVGVQDGERPYWGHGDLDWVRRIEMATGPPQWRTEQQPWAGRSSIDHLLLVDLREWLGRRDVTGIEEAELWCGDPVWQGDVAPPRPTRRRVEGVWPDLCEGWSWTIEHDDRETEREYWTDKGEL